MPTRSLNDNRLTLTIHEQLIASQSLLELRAHESVTRTRLRENREVNIEERKIDDERNQNEADCAGGKMSPEVLLRDRQGVFLEVVVVVTTHHVRSFLEVENVPQVDENGGADCEDRENAVNFGAPGASHEYTSRISRAQYANEKKDWTNATYPGVP